MSEVKKQVNLIFIFLGIFGLISLNFADFFQAGMIMNSSLEINQTDWVDPRWPVLDWETVEKTQKRDQGVSIPMELETFQGEEIQMLAALFFSPAKGERKSVANLLKPGHISCCGLKCSTQPEAVLKAKFQDEETVKKKYSEPSLVWVKGVFEITNDTRQPLSLQVSEIKPYTL